jgi:hypothetical protein
MGPILGAMAAIVVVVGGAHLLCRWAVRYVSAQPVTIGDLLLPPSYVRRIIWGRHNHFIVPRAADAYGRFWEPGVLYLFHTVEYLQRIADARKQRSLQDLHVFVAAADAWAIDPNFVSYISDFSRLLCVGGMDNLNVILLDYRADPHEPSVLCWNGVYWQRVAPDCESFLSLLEPQSWRRHRRWKPAVPRGPGVTGCVTAALEAVAHYDIWDTDVLIWIVWSHQNRPTVVLVPDPLGRKPASGGTPDWQIQVTGFAVSEGVGAQPSKGGVTVTTRGTLREVDPEAPHARLGQAVAAASRHLVSEYGGPELGGLVRAYRIPGRVSPVAGRYMIDVRGVERWVGPRPKIWVSEDLTQVRVG